MTGFGHCLYICGSHEIGCDRNICGKHRIYMYEGLVGASLFKRKNKYYYIDNKKERQKKHSKRVTSK
jgi:hypothetical protein